MEEFSSAPTSITTAGKSPSFTLTTSSPTSITAAGKSPSFTLASYSPTSISAAGKSPSFNSPPTTPTPRTPTTPSTPTFLFPDMTTSDNLLRSAQGGHQPSPRIQRSFAHRLGQLAYERERANSIEERPGNISPTAAVLDIAPFSVDDEGRGGRGRRELFRPEGRGKEAERGGGGGGTEERRDTGVEGLLSTNEDIFVIPPQMSIDEKLFQDEVILWSHYVKLPDALKQPQSIFNFVFFGFFFITTVALAYFANLYISVRAIFVTVWLLAPILFFSGFLLAKLLLEHTCYFVTNYRVIQCKLLGARITSKSMSYPSITDIRLGKNAISIYAKHNYHFLKFIGLDNVNAVNKILQQQRENSAQIGPLDSPQSLDTQHIPEKYVNLIHSADLPFLEVNRASSLTAKYLWGTIKFAVAYLWVGGLLFLTHAGPGWMIPYFVSIILLPIIFLLTNTLDKVDVLGARSVVFLRVGLAYIKQCRYGRNVLRLSYENAYPLISSYNVKNNNGDIAFYNYTFANVASEDVIATEEIIFHKYLDAIYNATS